MGKKKKEQAARLEQWQEWLEKYDDAWAPERTRMDEREKIIRGRTKLNKVIESDETQKTNHVWNIAYELTEAQVDSTIPAAKVTPLRKEDEELARMLEDLIRNKLDEWPSEVINDQMERTVPQQGAGLVHLEWDARLGGMSHDGQSVISFVHPKQISPQPGVTSDIEDMDRIIVKVPVTKSFVKRTFGVDVSDEGEEDPSVRGVGENSTSDEIVTLNVGYFRNDGGGIGKFSWVNDTVLEDYDDYQARRVRKCTKCGRVEPNEEVEPLEAPTLDGTYPGGGTWAIEAGELRSEDAMPARTKKRDGTCPYCGAGRFEDAVAEYEEVWGNGFDVTDDEGNVLLHVNGEHWVETTDEDGNSVQTLEPTRIPYYKPDIFPVIMRKIVSMWGKLMGDSDIDQIEDQQNTINRMEQKILDSLLTAGSYITLPPDTAISTNNREGKIIRLKNAADKAMIDVYTLQADIAQTMAYMQHVYEEARNTIGVTDSFQGRQDTTAQSGKAKEISAAQAAGRFQSKRVMKQYFWSRLYEALVKFQLAYADDERPVVGRDKNGEHRDEVWNKYRFLRYDEVSGEYYWNIDFLFSVDSAGTLSKDREAMWQEMNQYYTSGAFGAPAETGTQIMFWMMMEQLHYPNAGDIKRKLIEAQETQRALQQQAAQMQLEAQQTAAAEAETRAQEQENLMQVQGSEPV